MSRTSLAFVALVTVEVVVIAGLSMYVLTKRASHISTITPLAKADITQHASDRLPYFYDLATEKTAIPDWLPYRPVYVRNQDQLNDTSDYTPQKPPGTYRVITLGDSWTFGMYIDTKDAFSDVLEGLLNTGLERGTLTCKGITHFDVLNFGVGGYDIEYMVERLRLRGVKYYPDLVLPLVKYDDFTLVSEIWQPRVIARYAAYGNIQGTVVNGVAKDPRQDIARELEKEIQSLYTEDELLQHETDALKFLSTFYKGPLFFFVYGSITDAQQRALHTYANTRGSSFIYQGVPMLSSEEKVPHDEHPNAQGHARFAQALLGQLIAQGTIPCSTVR